MNVVIFNFSNGNVGVIIRLKGEKFDGLFIDGEVVECEPTALQKRRQIEDTYGLDSKYNRIKRKDFVTVIKGPHAVSILFLKER